MPVDVKFKRGLHADLPTNNFDEGSFYLTTDSDRLFFAQAANDLIEITSKVRVASSTPTQLTYPDLAAGDIFVTLDQGLLLRYNGVIAGKEDWTQLNPNTVLVNNAGALSASNNGTNTNAADINLSVADSIGNTAAGAVTLTGGSNVTITRSNNNITISSTDTNDNTTYTLGTTANTNSGTVTLTPSSGTASSISISGTGGLKVTSNGSGEITIAGSSGVDSITNTFNGNGNFVTTVSQNGNNVESTAITPKITYGSAVANKTDAVFSSGTAVLDIYTKNEIDALIEQQLKDFDAMEYAGTIAANEVDTKLVATITAGETPKVGTTYKASGSFTLNGTQVKAGDLIIAKGTDGDVTWDVVPSGDDQTITGSVSGHNMSVLDGSGTIAGITVNGSNDTDKANIVVTNAIADNVNTLTLSHGSAGAGVAVTAAALTTLTTQQSKQSIDVPILTSLSKDAVGHVTNATIGTYRFVDTHGTVTSHSYVITNGTGTASGHEVSVTDALQFDGDDNSASFAIKSDTLQVSKPDGVNAVQLDLVWGTF